MEIRIGTAGYSYPAWVGPFYPAGATDHDLLPYYARHFPAVEINSTFYRPPAVAQVAKMARRTPPGFGFTLKAPRSASHGREPGELPAFRAAADHLAELGRLLGLLVQVPESFRQTPANRDWLLRVADGLRPHRTAVEFRHVSWDTPDLGEWLADAGLDVVSVGVPAVPTLFPAGVRVANRRVYARLHSQDAGAWYAGGPRRYDYDYPDPVLRKWAGALAASGAESAVVFFNNCVGVRRTSLDNPGETPVPQAVANARLFARVLREVLPPTARVVEPEPGRVPSLFPE